MIACRMYQVYLAAQLVASYHGCSQDDEKWKEIKLWIATLAVKHNDVIKENQKLIPELYQPANLTEKVKFSHHIMGVVAVAFYSLTPLKVDKNSEMWKDARTMSYFFQKLVRRILLLIASYLFYLESI